MTREEMAPTGGMCFDVATTHNPLELIERLVQRQPATSPHHKLSPPAAAPVDLLDSVLSLHDKLEEAARLEAIGSSSERPDPVILPVEQDKGSDGPPTLPRSREKAALLRERFSPASSCSHRSEPGDAGGGTESGAESSSSSEHDACATGLTVDAPPLAYTLVSDGFAIYVDTPLRKRLADADDEEDEESSDEEYEEDSDDESEPRRRVLGVLDMNIEYH